MKNDVLVRNIEELRENFDVESLVEHFESGRLQIWLEDHYYEEIAAKVASLDHNQDDFINVLCEALGIHLQEHEIPELDAEYLKRRVEKLEYLKTLTEDETIWDKVDDIAIDQEDLVDFIDAGKKTVYLCGGTFVIPLSVPNMTYIGIFHPCAIIRAIDNINFKERNIVFHDVPFFWNVSGLTTKDRSFQGEWLFMEGRYEESAVICRELAKENNPRAILLLYRIFSRYLIDQSEAQRYKKLGTELNFAYSLLDNDNGQILEKSKGTLRRLAQSGTALDKFYYGVALYQLGSQRNGVFDDDMLEVFFAASKQGNPDASNSLGLRYEYGQGIGQDYTKAMEWYQKAAERGNICAKYNIGELYYYGRGVGRDYQKALEWYQRAAEQYNVDAQLSIGFLYEHGYGVDQDYAKAMEWYQKAAEQGDIDAQFKIGYFYDMGYGVTRDYKNAMHWYTKAAEQGHAGAQFKIGYFYDMGYGVTQDYKNAMHWYTKAAEQNHLTAQNNIGAMYEDGHGVKQDYEKAMEWYMKAAEQGDAWSQKNIGNMYYNGTGVNRDLQEAKKWFQKAADNGNSYAKDKLKEL